MDKFTRKTLLILVILAIAGWQVFFYLSVNGKLPR